jgi:hypothetical protein
MGSQPAAPAVSLPVQTDQLTAIIADFAEAGESQDPPAGAPSAEVDTTVPVHRHEETIGAGVAMEVSGTNMNTDSDTAASDYFQAGEASARADESAASSHQASVAKGWNFWPLNIEDRYKKMIVRCVEKGLTKNYRYSKELKFTGKMDLFYAMIWYLHVFSIEIH